MGFMTEEAQYECDLKLVWNIQWNEAYARNYILHIKERECNFSWIMFDNLVDWLGNIQTLEHKHWT